MVAFRAKARVGVWHLKYHFPQEAPVPRLRSLVIESLETLALLALTCGTSGAQKEPNPAATPLLVGQIIESAPCAADPAQSYALYLPSGYSPAKAWPIIYVFDPGARGKVPVRLYKDAVEKYGYIIAASNNARNFQSDVVTKAAKAMWDDTHVRLSLDQRRIYMMGFSGGARVATELAVVCEQCAIAGVIAHGAGYPFPPSDKERFAYFAFIGDKDFNWPEVMELRRKKEECCAPYQLRLFRGEHQWAPPEIFGEAIAWLQLVAMQRGIVPPDSVFIDQQFGRIQEEAEDALHSKDAMGQFEAYRSLALDFSGLKDVTSYQAKLAALKASPELKQARKKEQEAIDQQRAITQELSSDLSRVGEADLDQQQTLRGAILDSMAGLEKKAERAKNDEARLISLRAFNELWVQGIEAGQAALQNHKQLAKAELYFQLMSAATPDEPWPALLLAETAAARGDKKRACKDLREAVRRGLKNSDAIELDPNLQSLRNEPDFQQIVAELKAKREAQPEQ